MMPRKKCEYSYDLIAAYPIVKITMQKPKKMNLSPESCKIDKTPAPHKMLAVKLDIRCTQAMSTPRILQDLFCALASCLLVTSRRDKRLMPAMKLLPSRRLPIWGEEGMKMRARK